MLSTIPPEAVTEVEEVLHTLGQESGMPTILLTRIEDTSWSAWAVRDDARFGFAIGQRTDASRTLCNIVRREGTPLALDDTRNHVSYRDHPACTDDGVGAYIGVPLRLPDGMIIGTLCALDRAPHVGLEAALRLYRLFARLLAHEFDLTDVARASLAALHSETQHGASRERFFAAVAHDLRSPLAAIEATAQMIVRSGDRRSGDRAARIVHSAARMARLIDDLLDLARGRLGGGIPIQRTPLPDVRAFLYEVVGELSTAHPGRVHADIAVAAEVVWWDRDRIAQCLDNIVTNACVHGTPATEVTLAAHATSSHVIIDVTNAGEIPAHARATLFDPFHGAQTVRRGLGLGMFIADQIVRAHGGSIDVGSVGGETRVRLRLPLWGTS